MNTLYTPTDPNLTGNQTLYTPTDPNLTGSQALPFLQNCIDRVAQVAVLTGNSEQAIRRHISEHDLYFNAILRVLDQAFQLPVILPPAVVRTENTTEAAQTATHEPEPDYSTTHDPSLGYHNPYPTMEPQNQGPYFNFPPIQPGETSATATTRPDADQDAKYEAGFYGTQTHGHDG